MARKRPTDNPNPHQLTLDDWAEIIEAECVVAQSTQSRKRVAASAPSGSARGRPASDVSAVPAGGAAGERHSAATKLLERPGALLTRTHLREFGLERRAVDAIFRALPVVAIPGYSRPMIRVEQYLKFVEKHTYRDDRVRSCHAAER